ncbi:MAG: thioredoxin family protein [Proteobacteria bacterium]|nr:MAG: thioredoxin family protein [Pseudomonadota bacterium]
MFGKFRSVFATASLVLLIASFTSVSAQMAQPFVKKHLYDSTANPRADIAAALKQAKGENKRVILDFGGDWCGDCQVLDIYMHQSPNAQLIDKHFVVVHIDIGRMDHNVDVAEKYRVPINKGVPALAVLDANGKLLYSQENKEFENMGNVKPSDVTDFLNRWKA